MKHLVLLMTSAITLCLLSSCLGLQSWDNNPRGNFEALWTVIDEHYCFFADKTIDWNNVHDQYSRKISDEMTSEELFRVCAGMLDELQDGHTNLSSGFATSYYSKWWSDYPQNFDLRLIQQYYFNFNYTSLSGMFYGILPQNIGYIYYPSFSLNLGHGNISWILKSMATCNSLIIDIRDNGGGDMTASDTWVSHFITSRILAGYFVHKTGPGHNDFSEPWAYYIDPAPEGSIIWRKPVVILTNRSTFSAANNFVSIMQYVDGVRIVGSTTGGGSGMPYSSELPNGWGIRMSACSVLDAKKKVTEFGITPSVTVDLDLQQALSGKDTMLDEAIRLLTEQKQ